MAALSKICTLLLRPKSITMESWAVQPDTNILEAFDFITGKGNIMFRLWARIFKDNHMLQDTCIADSSADTRTHKVFRALDEICLRFDLSRPIWLDKSISDFKRHGKVRFTQDNLWKALISIIWKFISLKKIKQQAVPLRGLTVCYR